MYFKRILYKIFYGNSIQYGIIIHIRNIFLFETNISQHITIGLSSVNTNSDLLLFLSPELQFISLLDFGYKLCYNKSDKITFAK